MRNGTSAHDMFPVAAFPATDARLVAMAPIAQLLEQRSSGSVDLRMERRGVAILREEGAAKCRIPRGSDTAILINSSGGLAGGDNQSVRASVGPAANLILTTQAAERVYRSLGPPADVSVALAAEAGATLHWLPQETILFDGGSLQRRIDVELAADARFLAVESLLLGRTERQEMLSHVHVSDHWTVRCCGQLVHAERLKLAGHIPDTLATLGGNRAMATLLFIAPDVQSLLPKVRQLLGPSSGASVFSVAGTGKLIARFLAKDGYGLRKSLVPVLSACLGPHGLPKVWTL